MNYYPAVTIEHCLGEDNCTFLSLNAHAIRNLLNGYSIDNAMGENQNLDAKATRGGAPYEISNKGSSIFSAKLVSHDVEEKQLSFQYSITLTVEESGRMVIEKNKIASLSGDTYDKFIRTMSQDISVPNKILINKTEALTAFACYDGAKSCISDAYYYSDYNLYLAIMNVNLNKADLKGNESEAFLEYLLTIVLATVNPKAAEFYSAPYQFTKAGGPNPYRPESIVIGMDAEIDGLRYVGYAQVKEEENTIMLSHAVEQTQESLIQFISRGCNVARNGNSQREVIQKYCDFHGKE